MRNIVSKYHKSIVDKKSRYEQVIALIEESRAFGFPTDINAIMNLLDSEQQSAFRLFLANDFKPVQSEAHNAELKDYFNENITNLSIRENTLYQLEIISDREFENQLVVKLYTPKNLSLNDTEDFLKTWNYILKPYVQLVGGTTDNLQLLKCEVGSLELVLGFIPESFSIVVVVGALAKAVKWCVKYKQELLVLRKVEAEVRKTEAEANQAEVETDRKLSELYREQAITKFIDTLINEYLEDEKANKSELKNLLKDSLETMSEEILKGTLVDIKGVLPDNLGEELKISDLINKQTQLQNNYKEVGVIEYKTSP